MLNDSRLPPVRMAFEFIVVSFVWMGNIVMMAMRIPDLVPFPGMPVM